VELIRGFYETLAGHEDTCVSIQEDKVISLIEAIRRSSLEGRTILWKEMEEQ
jgi:UDP-N-acetyl-2-amino-2-deoxyglucuronate dehydrogenase